MKQQPPAIAKLYVFLFAGAWFVHEWILVGVLALALLPLFVGGFVMWRVTTYRVPIDPRRIIIPYLFTVIFFIAHVCEEYVAYMRGYHHILEGSPFKLTLELLLMFAATLAPILWLLGAILLLKGWPVGFFAASTFLFGMMFVEPTHCVART